MRNKVTVGSVGDPGVRVVEPPEGGNDANDPTGTGHTNVAAELAGSQQDKGQIKKEKQAEKGHRRLQSHQNQQKGEDGPAHQEKTNGIGQHGGVLISSTDPKGLDGNTTITQPETTITNQSRTGKTVTNNQLPNPRQKLHRTPVKTRQTKHHGGHFNPHCLGVVQR